MVFDLLGDLLGLSAVRDAIAGVVQSAIGWVRMQVQRFWNYLRGLFGGPAAGPACMLPMRGMMPPGRGMPPVRMMPPARGGMSLCARPAGSCFVAGTWVRTDEGDVAVEALDVRALVRADAPGSGPAALESDRLGFGASSDTCFGENLLQPFWCKRLPRITKEQQAKLRVNEERQLLPPQLTRAE